MHPFRSIQGFTMIRKSFAIATAALIASASGAQAATIQFSDFDSFAGAPTAGDFVIYTPGTVVDGWTAGANGLEVQNNAAGAPFSTPNLVELDVNVNSTMFVNLAAGIYNVSYWYSPRPNVAASSNTITLSIGNTLLDSITGEGGGDTVWSLRSVNFTTTGGALTFAAAGDADGVGGFLDSITISAVPEASTWAMLILGFGLAGYGLRRSNRAAIA